MKIKTDIYQEMVQYAQAGAPLEVCGYLAGSGDTVSAQHQLKNTDASGEHFSMDPAEQFAVMKRIRADGLGITAVWHSHPATPARPSEEDIRLAFDPDILYVILSLAGELPDVKAFRIRDGAVEKEPVEII